MTSLDTNVVLRFVTRDHPVQSLKARDLIEAGPVWVSKTVILETEWVLRSGYEKERGEIVGILRAFLGLPQITVEDPDGTALALELYAGGFDFADALHLVTSRRIAHFATFDKELRRRAARVPGLPPVIEP